LPAEAIEREDVGRWEGAGRQGAQEKNVLCCLETARVGFLAALLGVFQQALLLGLRLLWVLASDNQAQDQWLPGRSLCRAFVHAALTPASLPRLSGKRRKKVKWPAVRLQQAQRVPAGTHDEVCTGIDHGPQIARPRIAAITQHNIARPVGQALQVLGT